MHRPAVEPATFRSQVRRASHYTTEPFLSAALRVLHVRLSVCPSVPYGMMTRKQNKKTRKKSKLVQTSPGHQRSANLQMKRSKFKVTGRQKPSQQYGFVYIRAADQEPAAAGDDCKLDLTNVRPNLLSTTQALGNCTDGRISCRYCFLVKRANCNHCNRRKCSR